MPKPLMEPRGPLARSAPVFVTLYEGDQLRGCIGELEARYDNLLAETMDRAVAAAFEDPRFPPLRPEELDRCRIEVSVLGPLEPVRSLDELDPHRYGIVVADRAGRRAVLLPGIRGVEEAAQQVEIARRKAGIPAAEPISLMRFSVVKVAEPEPKPDV